MIVAFEAAVIFLEIFPYLDIGCISFGQYLLRRIDIGFNDSVAPNNINFNVYSKNVCLRVIGNL